MKDKKSLIVDMDGVLADIYKQLIKLEFEESGTRITVEETMGKTENDAFPNCQKLVKERGFFRNAPVMPGAIEVLKKLNEHYQLFVVSSAMEYPNSLEEKYYWMQEYFPFISWKQLVLCGTKTCVKGDIMIDDHFKNLDYFEGKTILFTQPHNSAKDENSHQRVHGWNDILKLLGEV
ncbi:5' nucleotidase, NT5C type [Lutimonas sp.]|uniref:5' nucleotidase, NT5C type n=1 Tax=Lutimonas sp. TaxID=1872403 RepID=UPI003D9AC5F1